MRIRVKKSLPNSVDDPFETAKGKVVEVRFDESADDFAGLKLQAGDQVIIWLGLIDGDGAYGGAYGSNASWMAVRREGSFRREDGTATDPDGLFPR